jgi:hypothetical protein
MVDDADTELKAADANPLTTLTMFDGLVRTA